MNIENKIEIQELNIQPQAGVIGVFSRLNYKPWYAIAEFVDNSTQSFYSHQNELAEHGITEVEITIDYDSEKDILTITDTAFGMEFDDFSRAVKIDSPPENKNGRNEFGMGLKTAASWFGNIWSVKSTALGSSSQYYTEINIPQMRENNVNFVEIHKTLVEPVTHGTTIVIREVTKKIGSARTKNKITELLKSMYRRDLNNGLVQIIYDGEPLYFDEYACLTFRDKEWRKNVNFSFDFDGITHNVVGFVGILANGGFGRAGFALFRRGRVLQVVPCFINPSYAFAYIGFASVGTSLGGILPFFSWSRRSSASFTVIVLLIILFSFLLSNLNSLDGIRHRQLDADALRHQETDVVIGNKQLIKTLDAAIAVVVDVHLFEITKQNRHAA